MNGQQTPVAKIQAGQVSAALWENQVEIKGKTVTLLKTTIQRRYRDRDGNWQSSSSFGRNDIPLAVYCLQKIFEKILERQKEGSNGDITEEISMD